LEARIILGEELDCLPGVYREPILLCLYEGATQDEAARRLGCPLRTLKRRLERGRALLAQRLSRRGLDPASGLALILCLRSQAPVQLVHKTIAAATQFTSGQALTGTAVVLAEGVLRTVIVQKVGVYVALFVALGSLALAGGFALAPATPTPLARNRELPQEQEVAPRAAANVAQPSLDANGDPLPEGAVPTHRLRSFAPFWRPHAHALYAGW
jgi:hypothetical protein